MIELFYEPTEILTSIDNNHSAEMSKDQSAFVCGLIKKYKPKKILEIGVAAGGTTAVIMNCCNILGLNTEIYSVDLMEYYYRDNTKKTGYLIEKGMAKIAEGGGNGLPSVKMYRGGIYLEFANDIGSNIDMVILDTVHALPGEILDFLSCFPALHKGCVCVLHDIRLNHSGHDRSFATKVLFDTVVADKIIEDTGNFEKYPNVAAFVINDNTSKYIRDVFSALTITWEYMPENRHIELYKNFFGESYPQNMSNMFVTALELNKRTLSKKRNNNIDTIVNLYNLLEKVKGKRIYIYGCGKRGKKLYEL